MRNWMIAGAVTLALALAAWLWFRPDPDLAKARELQSQLAALGENADRDERRALMERMRAQMDQLTDEQRRSLFDGMRGQFQDRMRAAVDGYFALPEAQRRGYLDQRIREMEQRRRQMEQRFAEGSANGGQTRRGFPGGPPDGQRAGGERAGDGPGERAGGRDRAMLDRASPEERARSTEYFSALERRRRELGLPEMPFGRR